MAQFSLKKKKGLNLNSGCACLQISNGSIWTLPMWLPAEGTVASHQYISKAW